jgi:hypothetical protein
VVTADQTRLLGLFWLLMLVEHTEDCSADVIIYDKSEGYGCMVACLGSGLVLVVMTVELYCGVSILQTWIGCSSCDWL